MRTPSSSRPVWLWFLVARAPAVLGLLLYGRPGVSKEGGITVTVGPAHADVIGTDNVAIQKAIDRVAAAGGGTVVIEAWRREYNESRPHRALGERTPSEFANEVAGTRDFIGQTTAENSP